MKFLGVFTRIIASIMIFASMIMAVFAVQATEPSQNMTATVSGSSFGIDATHALLGGDNIVKNAEAAFLYEYSSQTLMYAWNADERMDPASMVKIMTALIAVENGTLSDVAVVTAQALSTVPHDAVSADLQEDELLTLEELLYCMMVGSANDAAAVIAEHIGGSVDAFVTAMNNKAAELGCQNTNFTNPHGIYEEQQFTTARDMARILTAALQNETFLTVFGTVRHQVPATNKSEARDLSTGNFLMNTDEMPLYYDERVVGGRTGVAGDGTRCLATVAQHNGMSLLSILMGSKSVYEEDGYTVRSYGGFNETIALLSAGFDGYKVAQILYPGQSLVQLPVKNGSSHVVLGPVNAASAVLPANISLNDLVFRYDDKVHSLSAPVTQGEDVGKLEIWNGNTCIAESTLCALNNVSVYSVPDSMDKKDTASAAIVTWIVVIVVLIGVAVFLVVRFSGKIRRLLHIRRSKRYRRSRRRSF